MLTKLSDMAFFCIVWPSVADTQPRIHELTAYTPIEKRKHATYRAAMFKVDAAMTKPVKATPMPAVICHVLSLKRPELMPYRGPMIAAATKGGHVRTRVMVWLKPSVPTTVGKKLVKPFAERWKFCISARRYKRRSPNAIFRLSRLLALVDCSTVSRLMRE